MKMMTLTSDRRKTSDSSKATLPLEIALVIWHEYMTWSWWRFYWKLTWSHERSQLKSYFHWGRKLLRMWLLLFDSENVSPRACLESCPAHCRDDLLSWQKLKAMAMAMVIAIVMTVAMAIVVVISALFGKQASDLILWKMTKIGRSFQILWDIRHGHWTEQILQRPLPMMILNIKMSIEWDIRPWLCQSQWWQ